MVTVYSKERCVQCQAVKSWLEARGIEYSLEDATKHIDYLTSLGYRQAPVVVTKEGWHFYGFDVGKLQQIAGSN